MSLRLLVEMVVFQLVAAAVAVLVLNLIRRVHVNRRITRDAEPRLDALAPKRPSSGRSDRAA